MYLPASLFSINMLKVNNLKWLRIDFKIFKSNQSLTLSYNLSSAQRCVTRQIIT